MVARRARRRRIGWIKVCVGVEFSDLHFAANCMLAEFEAIDLFQEHVLKEGPQNNESAVEQAKDKQIANMIRTSVGMREKK